MTTIELITKEDLKAFKSQYGYQALSQSTRMKTAAPIHSFKDYSDTINAIDLLTASKAVEEFIDILNRLQVITTNLVKVCQAEFGK